MLEKQLSDILAANLRRFIRDLNEEQLQISLWSGDLVLRDLQLQPDVLDQVALLVFQNKESATDVLNGDGSFLFSLGDTIQDAAAAQALLLPFTVVRGEIKELVISVPWSSLDCEPVSIEVRGVELIFGPLRSRAADPEEEQARLEVMKQRHLGQFEHERDAISAVDERDADAAEAATSSSASQAAQSSPSRHPQHSQRPSTRPGAASSLGSAIASMSFFEQLIQTITRNVHVVFRDVSIMYLLDYHGLHRSLASAVSLWFEQIVVTTTDEAFEDRFVMDLSMPVCKAVNASGIRVGVHEQRREGDESFACISEDVAVAPEPSAVSDGSQSTASPAAPVRHSPEASAARRERFFRRWDKSETLLELDELQLHIKLTAEVAHPSPSASRKRVPAGAEGDGNTATLTPHTSLAVTLGNALKTRFSFGAVLALESMARSLQNGLVGAPFRARLHLLEEPALMPALHESRRTLAQRRWAFALACVRDVLARHRQARASAAALSSPTRSTDRINGIGGKPMTPLQAMVAFGKLRREYCGLWQRNQQVPWLPRLDVAERQQMIGLEKRMTLEQIVFLRCMAYAELSVEAEAARQQQQLIESARARKACAQEGNASRLKGGSAGGLLSWFRRSPASVAPSHCEEGGDIIDVADLPCGDRRHQTTAPPPRPLYNPRRHFCEHLAAEWEVGRRFLMRRMELREAAAAAAAPQTAAVAAASDGVMSRASSSVLQADSVGAPEGTTGMEPASAPPMVLHVRCRRLQVTLAPQYWDERRRAEAFMSHLHQELKMELRSVEVFLDSVQEPREDRAGLSFFIASLSAWVDGAFRTPLLSSKGRVLPPPQGREDFLTFKQNAARTRRTLVISPSVFVLRPFHEMLWWGLELSDFATLLARRLGRSSLFFFSQNTMMATTTPVPSAACGEGATRRTASATNPLHPVHAPSLPVPAAIDVILHSLKVLVPLFAHDLPTPGDKTSVGSKRHHSGESTQNGPASQASVASTQLPTDTVGHLEGEWGEDEEDAGTGGSHSADDEDDAAGTTTRSVTEVDYSYNDFEDTATEQSRPRDGPSLSAKDHDERLSMVRGVQPNSSFAVDGLAREADRRGAATFPRRGGRRGGRRGRLDEEAQQEGAWLRPPGAVTRRTEGRRKHETEVRYFEGDACLVLSVPAVRLKTMRGAEKRFRGEDYEGQELFITIGDQRQAMRLYCQTGSCPFTKSEKIEVVSLSVIQLLINPDEVAVGVYNGAELTIDPAAFALLNDRLFKPLELYSSTNLRHTQSLLQSMEARGSAVTSTVGSEGTAGNDWHFASATELFLTCDALVTMPDGEGREYVTLLHRWWHTRRRHREQAPQPESMAAPPPPSAPRTVSAPHLSDMDCRPSQSDALAGRCATMDFTICVEFVRVIIRSARQEDVAEVELMAPNEAPTCTREHRDALSVFSDVPHSVEILLQTRKSLEAAHPTWQHQPLNHTAGTHALPRGAETEALPVFALVSIPDAAVSTAVGKPLSNIEHFSVTFQHESGARVQLDSVSLFFSVEVAECVETVFGVVKTLQQAPLPLAPLDVSPAPPPPMETALPPPPVRVSVDVGSITAQFPLSSQTSQPFRALSARTKRFLVDVHSDDDGAFAITVSGYMKEVVCIDEDVVNDDLVRFPLVGPSSGLLSQPEYLSYQCRATIPARGSGADAVLSTSVSCAVTAKGGHLCVNVPFMIRCGSAMEDPLYANLLALGQSSTFRHGLSFFPRGGDVGGVEALAGGSSQPPRGVSLTPAGGAGDAGEASLQPAAFTASVSNVEVLVATDANLPVDITDDSTFFYISLGRMEVAHKLVPCQDGPPRAEGLRNHRRRLSFSVDSLSYSPTSDRPPLTLPLQITVDMDFGVLLVPKKDLSGYQYTPGDTRHDFTILVNIEQPASAVANSPTKRPPPPAIDLVLPPSRVSALLRAVTLNLIQYPVNAAAPKQAPTSVGSTPRRPLGSEAGEQQGRSFSYAANRPSPPAVREPPETATPAFPAATPSIAIMLTVPSLRIRLLTEDQRVFALRVADGLQYYRAAGSQWARCPAQNVQLRSISVEEVSGGRPAGKHGTAEKTSDGGSAGDAGAASARTSCLTLLQVNRIGLTALVSIDAAPVHGSPNYIKVDLVVDSLSVYSHVLPWTSLATLLFTQAQPIAQHWPSAGSADQMREGEGQNENTTPSTADSNLPSGRDSAAEADPDSTPVPARATPQQRPAASGECAAPPLTTPDVVVLSEVAASFVNTQLILVREGGGDGNVEEAARLHAPKVVAEVVQSSDDTTRLEVAAAEPPTFVVRGRQVETRAVRRAMQQVHEPPRCVVPLDALDFHMLDWQARPTEKTAVAKEYVKVSFRTWRQEPVCDAPLQRAAVVGELMSAVPGMQETGELSIFVGGLRVLCHTHSCLALTALVQQELIPALEAAANLHHRVVAISGAAAADLEKPFRPQRTTLLVHGELEEARLIFFADGCAGHGDAGSASFGCTVAVGHARLRSSLVQSAVEGLGSVVATVPVKNAFGWCLALDVAVQEIRLRCTGQKPECGTAAVEEDGDALDSQASVPVDLPPVELRLCFPLFETTFMEVVVEPEEGVRDLGKGGAENEGATPLAISEYVFPPPSVYNNGRATFIRSVECHIGGTARSSSSTPATAVNPGHLAHFAKLARDVSHMVLSSAPIPAPAGSLRPATNASSRASRFQTRLKGKVELVSGFVLRLMENASVPLAELQLLHPANATFQEGGEVRVGVEGQFEVTDRHGTVLLSRQALDGPEAHHSMRHTLSATCALGAKETNISVETCGVVVHLSPDLVDVGVSAVAVMNRLQRCLAACGAIAPQEGQEDEEMPESGTWAATAPPSKRGSPLASTAPELPAHDTPQGAERKATVQLVVHSIGVAVGRCGLLVARGTSLDVTHLLLPPAGGGGSAPSRGLSLSVREAVLARSAREPFRFVEAARLTLSQAQDSVDVGVEQLTVTNNDGSFWGDLAEQGLVLASYLQAHVWPFFSSLSTQAPVSQRIHVTLHKMRLRLLLPHAQPTEPSECVEGVLPSLRLTYRLSPAGNEFSVAAENAKVVARGLWSSSPRGAKKAASPEEEEWALAKQLSLSFSAITAVAGPLTTVSVRLGAVDVALPLGDTLQRCAEAISLLLLQLVPTERFITALSQHASGVAERERRLRTQRYVVEVAEDGDGSIVSSLHDRSSAPSTRSPSSWQCNEPLFALPPPRNAPGDENGGVACVAGESASGQQGTSAPESRFSFSVPSLRLRAYRDQGTSAASAVFEVALHRVSARAEHTSALVVSAFQITEIVGSADGKLQEEFLSATTPLEATPPSSRAAVYFHREDRFTAAAALTPSPDESGKRAGAMERHSVTARVHALRFTLSPALLHLLNDDLFARVAAGVSWARFAAAGFFTDDSAYVGCFGAGAAMQAEAPAASSNADDRGSQQRRAGSGNSPSPPVCLFASGDSDNVTHRIPRGIGDEFDDADDGATTDVDDGYGDSAPSSGDHVIVISTNLRLQEDLILGGRRGPRLHFRKGPVAPEEDVDSGRHGGFAQNVLTVKSVNHARLVLSMVELTPQGLQCAPIIVDEGLTIRVEGTPVVLETDDPSMVPHVQDFVALGDRSLFSVPESLIIRPEMELATTHRRRNTALSEVGSAGGSIAPLPKQQVLAVITDVSVFADVRLQLWSRHQTLAVLAEADAQYHTHRIVSEEGIMAGGRSAGVPATGPRAKRSVEFLDETGEIAIRHMRLLSDSGPITATPATLVVHVKHHKLPEDQSKAGVTVVKAVLPAIRLTISTGHLRLLHDVAWQLRAGSAHIDSVVTVEDEMYPPLLANVDFGCGDAGWEEGHGGRGGGREASFPLGAPSGARDVTIPPVSPTRQRTGTSAALSSTWMTDTSPSRTRARARRRRAGNTARCSHRKRRTSQLPQHGLAATAAANAPSMEIGLTAPSMELVVTNDFFRPEVTVKVETASVLAKGQRDRSAVSCAATATLSVTDHPLLDPPRTLVSVAPEVTLEYLSFERMGSAGGKSLKVALACPEAVLTLPVHSALRLLQSDFAQQQTGALSFRNELGIPIVLGSVGGGGASAVQLADEDGAFERGEPTFCELPVDSMVKPEIFHYNQTRFRVIPAEDAPSVLIGGGATAASRTRRAFMKGVEVDISALQKGATYHFPLLESAISAGGVMDVVMRLDEMERVVSFTSAVKIVNELSTHTIALPGDLLHPLTVAPGKSRFVTFTALQQPFCILVANLRSNVSIPPLLTLQSVIGAFLLLEDRPSWLRGKQKQASATAALSSLQQLRDRTFWNHAYMPDASTLVVPLLLSGDADTSTAPATQPSPAPRAPPCQERRVVNLVLRRQIAQESRPRTARLMPKYEVELCVQPVVSLINLTGATLDIELFTSASTAPQRTFREDTPNSTGDESVVRSGALAHTEQFDWFPKRLEETAFAPHALLEMTVGTARLRSVGAVELLSAAAQTSQVVALAPKLVGSAALGDVGPGKGKGSPVAALVLERVSESVIVVRATAILENRLPYPVHVRYLTNGSTLVGCGERGVLTPGARHPLFLPCPPNARPPSADAPVSLRVGVVAGRPCAAGAPTGVTLSDPFLCTAPTLSALLSSEEQGCEHYLAATLTVKDLPGRSAPLSQLKQRTVVLQPAFVVHNAHPTMTLVIHSPGLADSENMVVPPLQTVDVVDFGLPASSGSGSQGDPELIFCYASQLPDWQYVWSHPVRLTTLATAAVPTTFKHRLGSVKTRSRPRRGEAVNDEEAADDVPVMPGACGADRAAARLHSSVRVPLRHGDVPETEWFSALTLTPSAKGSQSVVSVNLEKHPPLRVENRTPHRVQFEQKLLAMVGGPVVSPTSSSIATSLSPAQQFLCGYLVEPFSDASACWDAVALEAPAIQLSVMIAPTGRVGRAKTAVCLIDLHKVESSKQAVKVTGNVFAFVSHDYRQRCFHVTITEDRALESMLVFQPRLIAHMELFIRDLRLFVASTCVPSQAMTLEQTRFASLTRRHLLNINDGVTPESTEAEVLVALKHKELDLLLVRATSLFGEASWNERHILAHMTLSQVDVMDCTTPHPVYPLVLHMVGCGSNASGSGENAAGPQGSGGDAAVQPCFTFFAQARRPQVSTRQLGNFYAIRGASPHQLRAIQNQMLDLHRGGHVSHSTEAGSGSPQAASVGSRDHPRFRPGAAVTVPVSTRIVTVPIEQLRFGFGQVTLRLHDSFLFAIRQATEIALAERQQFHEKRLDAKQREAEGRMAAREQAAGVHPVSGEPQQGGDSAEAMPWWSASAHEEAPSEEDASNGIVSVLTVYDCFITQLAVSRVDLEVTLTRRVDGKCNPFAGLPIGWYVIPSVEAASLCFKGVHLRDINHKGPSLVRIAGAILWPAYRSQVILQGCKLLGSLEALGNPMALLGGWGRGVRSLVQGTVDMDFLGGARGFVTETRSCTLHHVGLLSRLGGRTLAALSRTSTDEDWLESPEARDGSLLYGLARGFTAGVGGTFTEPAAGARAAGMSGFMTGMSKGVVGLLTKPMAGFLYSVGSAADFYAQTPGVVPPLTEVHVHYLASNRNFPAAALTAPPSSLSSSALVTGSTPAGSGANSPVGAGGSFHMGSRGPALSPCGAATAASGFSGQRHTHSSSCATSPATATWRGSANASADFVSVQTYHKALGQLNRQHRVVGPEVARRLVADLGPHNFALHASYKDFWRYTTPEEFYNWFPVALGAELARTAARFLEATWRKERDERALLVSGAHQQLELQSRRGSASTSSWPDQGAEGPGAAVSAPTMAPCPALDPAENERARNIKATLGVRTLLKYVTLDHFVQVCTVAEIRANITPEDFQQKCGLLMMQKMSDTLLQLLSLRQD